MTQPKIVCAAMLMDDETVVTGVRHFSPDMRQTLQRIYGDGYHLRVKEQGFITTKYTFVSREEAWRIALEQNQITRRCGCDGDLYSENLY